MKDSEEERGGGSPVARGLCDVLQLPPLQLGAVGTPVRVSGAAGALISPETDRVLLKSSYMNIFSTLSKKTCSRLLPRGSCRSFANFQPELRVISHKS